MKSDYVALEKINPLMEGNGWKGQPTSHILYRFGMLALECGIRQ